MIRPTRLGFQALAFWMTLTAGFLATPYQNLFFLLVTFLTVLGLLTPIWVWSNLRGVTVHMTSAEPFAAGAAVKVKVPVTSVRHRPQVGILIATTEHKWRGHATIERGTSTIAVELPALPRGVHPITQWALESTYPFGFFRYSRHIPGPPALIVYPTPSTSALQASGAAQDGLHGSATAETTASLRPWRNGDRLRDVHWRATARSTQVVVREREQSGQGIEAVTLDRRCKPEELELALSALAALVMRKRDAGEPLRVSSQGWSDTYGQSGKSWLELLEKLASADTLDVTLPGPTKIPGAMQLPASTTIGTLP